ncbi:hypothetical protein SAMN05444365_10634 [Micromonospora pattaloongensis]|uniref:Uncharacterized protein n=1 Tax=Micromonospora pattaloongensis TaxID=405436 RepID=A0A1H3QN93_9ACTN|nr:hypothetical protein [Micromonospora pattaloongensis]SDZ15032.1 hypothetical protein SAMN05444365_10634 [Micromonospora pattaloongensis]
MTAVPGDALLAHVLRAVAGWLPERYGVLLEAGRFADGREALGRVATAGGARAATRGVAPGEAARLVELVLDRWAALGTVELPPLAVLLPPDDEDASYRLAVHGVDEGWTASWSGPVTPSADGRSAVPRPGSAGRVSARVFARSAAGRTVLTPVLHRDGAAS